MSRQPSTIQRISAIAAISENHVIGKDGKLPWNLPDDWENFHRVTRGKAFIMGRKSYEAEDALVSDYKNVIITHQKTLDLPEHSVIANSPEEALALLKQESEVFILGGSTIFEQMMHLVNYMYLTMVHHTFEGDAHFPEINWNNWRLVKCVYHEVDAKHAYPFSLNEYERVDVKN